EDHAGLERYAGTGRAEMQDIRFVVEQAAQSVADKIADDTHAFAFGHRLYRRTDVTRRVSRLCGRYARLETVICHLDQAFRLTRDFAHRIHAARVPVPAIHDQRQVDIDDVPLAQRPFVWNAVADHMIDRSAYRVAVALVEYGGRNCAMIAGEFIGHAVDCRGRYARLDKRGDLVKRPRGQRARTAHTFKAFLAMQRNDAGGAAGFGGSVDISNHAWVS